MFVLIADDSNPFSLTLTLKYERLNGLTCRGRPTRTAAAPHGTVSFARLMRGGEEECPFNVVTN